MMIILHIALVDVGGAGATVLTDSEAWGVAMTAFLPSIHQAGVIHAVSALEHGFGYIIIFYSGF